MVLQYRLSSEGLKRRIHTKIPKIIKEKTRRTFLRGHNGIFQDHPTPSWFLTF
jgi:hypothetical protein